MLKGDLKNIHHVLDRPRKTKSWSWNLNTNLLSWNLVLLFCFILFVCFSNSLQRQIPINKIFNKMKACISHDYMFEMSTINVIEAATSTLLFKKNYKRTICILTYICHWWLFICFPFHLQLKQLSSKKKKKLLLVRPIVRLNFGHNFRQTCMYVEFFNKYFHRRLPLVYKMPNMKTWL